MDCNKLTELDNVKRDLLRSKDINYQLNEKLDKALFLLSDWLEEYFQEGAIDPQTIQNNLNGIDESIEARNAAKWVIEAGRICTMIDIAQDYIYSAKQLAE